jgi:hypothetical protein
MIGAIGGSFSKKATEVAFDDLFWVEMMTSI